MLFGSAEVAERCRGVVKWLKSCCGCGCRLGFKRLKSCLFSSAAAFKRLKSRSEQALRLIVTASPIFHLLYSFINDLLQIFVPYNSSSPITFSISYSNLFLIHILQLPRIILNTNTYIYSYMYKNTYVRMDVINDIPLPS